MVGAALGLEVVEEGQSENVLGIDRVDGVVIGELNGEESVGVELTVKGGEVFGTFGGVGNVDVVDGRANDMSESVGVEKGILIGGPGSSSLGGEFGAGVEDPSILFFPEDAFRLAFTIVGEASADSRAESETSE